MKRSLHHIIVHSLLLVLLLPAIALAQNNNDPHDNAYVAPNGMTYTFVEQMPAFHGDVNAYLMNHLQYPELAVDSDWQGRVVVKFIVEQTGAVTHAEVVKSSGHEVLDREAARVIGGMPAWKPGSNAGVPVKVYFMLPVSFSLDKHKLQNIHKDDVHHGIERGPEFRGDLSAYLQEHLIYPKIARRRDWEGCVYVKCVIDTLGAIHDVALDKSSGYKELDEEAMRVVRGMPNWRPASHNGFLVKVYFLLPVTFRLE